MPSASWSDGEPPPAAPIQLVAAAEAWPLAEPFVISRGVKTEAHVVIVEARRGIFVGRGECVPYARYGETIEGVLAAIQALGPVASRAELQRRLPAGAARNAVDCAIWDLEARESGTSVAAQLGRPLVPVTTCFTLSLGTPEAMAARAASVPYLPLLKLKLGGVGDAERMAAVRRARPDARLVADANEAWTADQLAPLLHAAAQHRFELIEQPLPAGQDDALATLPRPVAVCADESVHTRDGLAALRARYDAVNLKLDKTGGLTEGLATLEAAETLGFRVMVGCMVATSLAMAPALQLAQRAEWADLDGPLLLARDRPHGLSIANGIIAPPAAGLWG